MGLAAPDSSHHPAAPGNTDEAEAQELTDALTDLLLAESGFDADRRSTPFGDPVEGLIDALHRYAHPD
ncbi:hypothetical protein ACWEQL_20910 [Kitasatospora sp. NPDC004240]